MCTVFFVCDEHWGCKGVYWQVYMGSLDTGCTVAGHRGTVHTVLELDHSDVSLGQSGLGLCSVTVDLSVTNLGSHSETSLLHCIIVRRWLCCCTWNITQVTATPPPLPSPYSTLHCHATRPARCQGVTYVYSTLYPCTLSSPSQFIALFTCHSASQVSSV